MFQTTNQSQFVLVCCFQWLFDILAIFFGFIGVFNGFCWWIVEFYCGYQKYNCILCMYVNNSMCVYIYIYVYIYMYIYIYVYIYIFKYNGLKYCSMGVGQYYHRPTEMDSLPMFGLHRRSQSPLQQDRRWLLCTQKSLRVQSTQALTLFF